MKNRGFKNPEVIVSTQWVAEHLDDPDVRFIESNEDPLVYSAGHIPGAVEVDWTRDLNHGIRRDFIEREEFQDLIRRIGADEKTTFVIYGDKNNWWASYAFWVFKMYNIPNVKLMEGGRLKWVGESRQVQRTHLQYSTSNYTAPERDDKSNRAFRWHVREQIEKKGKMLDVRSLQEFTGEALHMPGYLSDGALRPGRMPGAIHIPWEQTVEEPYSTYRSYEEILKVYTDKGVSSDDELIVYCRIGKRSSHNWFVMKYLLGFEKVLNYDGGWLEWGNLVGASIEK